jgi:ATP/maltotriose-dependent transcriptional regulator MalT
MVSHAGVPLLGLADWVGLPDESTRRQAYVLELIAAGLSNAEIADMLMVSAATVKTHIN